jgi:hypothetical protein
MTIVAPLSFVPVRKRPTWLELAAPTGERKLAFGAPLSRRASDASSPIWIRGCAMAAPDACSRRVARSRSKPSSPTRMSLSNATTKS